MILIPFGTETDYATMTQKMTFLGKTIAEVKDQWQSLGTGDFKSKAGVLGGNLLTLFTSKPSAEFTKQLKKDLAALELYNRELEKGEDTAIDMDDVFKNASEACRGYADSLNKTTADTDAFAKGQKKAAKGVSVFKNAVAGIGAALASAAAMFVVSTVITKVVEGVTAVANASEGAANKLDELNSAYSQTQSDIEKLNSELESNKKLMDACRDTDTGVIVKQDEYERLEATNIMLAAQLKLKQALAKEEAQETNDYAHNLLTGQQEKNGFAQAFGKFFGTNTFETHERVIREGVKTNEFVKSKNADPLAAIKSEYEYIKELEEKIAKNALDYSNGKMTEQAYQRLDKYWNGKLEDAKENAKVIADTIVEVPLVDDGSETYKENAKIYQEIAQIYGEITGVVTPEDDTENKVVDKNVSLVKKYAMALYEAKGRQRDLSDEGKKSYAEIAEAAQNAGVSVSDFILSSLNGDEFANAATSVADAIGAVNEALNAQGTGVGITKEAYSALIAVNGEYADCLESVNGTMQINADRAQEVTKAAARQRVAELELAKAMQQQKYIENANDIEAIKDGLDSASPSLASWARENYKTIEIMEAENDTIADQCRQYDLLISQIYDVTGAYQGWLNAQNAGQGGDMLSDAKEAAQYIKEVLTDNTSDDYMKVGRTNVKYQRALDFVLPDSIDRDDEAAVEGYIAELNKFIGKNGTVMVDEVMKMLTDGNVFDPELAKNGIYKMLEGIKISDLMAALNTNEEVTQGVLGMLSDYGVYIDVTPAIKSFEDLEFYALGAADTLQNMPEYQNLNIDVNVEDLKGAEEKTAALQQTIDEMNGIVATPGINASDLQNATLVLQYCQEQINRLNGAPLNFENKDAVWKTDEVTGKLEQVEDKTEQKYEITIDTEQAMNNINTLEATLNGLPQEKIITIKSVLGIGVGVGLPKTGQSGEAKAAGTDMRMNAAGEPAAGRMLVGELGREILVNPKTGRWHTVGDNGAEFVNVPRGSIIFNSQQTEELLQQGWVNSRGMSRASGTARGNGSYDRGFSDFGATAAANWAGSSSLKYGASVQKAAENTAKATESTAKAAQQTKEETEDAKKAAQALRDEYDKAKDALDAQKKELNKIKDSLEEQQDIMDGIVDTVTDRIDKEIDRLEHMWDDLKDSLDDHKTDLDDALSAVQKILSDKIEEYQKAQDALDEAYEPRLEALQQEIDALKDKNDAEKEAIDLQKKKAALDAARTNKTMRVYREGQGYVWETDQTAIDEAQQEYSDALHDKTVNDLEKQKQALQDELDAEKEKIQKSIDDLEEYAEQWDDVSSAYTDQMNLKKLKELYGENAAEKILGMNQSFYEQFLKNYMDTEASIAEVDARIEENQKRIDELEKYKEKWEEVANAYEKEQNRINTVAQLGADWEQKILGMRIDVVDDFKNRYVNILQQIEEKIKEISALDEQIDGLEVDYKVKLAAVEGEGYAKGTLFATPGLHKTDEQGDEIKIRPCNSGYSILEKGTGVIPARQTATLWDFANDPEVFLSRIMNLKTPDIATNLQTPMNMQTVNVDVGGIVMNGVNDTYSFANELSSQFGNIMTQVLNKR